MKMLPIIATIITLLFSITRGPKNSLICKLDALNGTTHLWQIYRHIASSKMLYQCISYKVWLKKS